MILTGDYHTHTKYSDGKCGIAENVLSAKELGLKEIAITDHGFTHVLMGMRDRKFSRYLNEIKEQNQKSGISVLVGLEANILGREGSTDFQRYDLSDLDIVLAGIHGHVSKHEKFHDFINGWLGYVGYRLHVKPSKRLVRETTRAYIQAIKNNPIDILTHLCFQCYADAKQVARCCADYGTYVELSGKKTHLTDEVLDAVVQTGVRFVVNSDAHSPKRIADIALAEEQIVRVGVPLDRIDNIDGRTPSFRFQEYKRKHV